MRLALLACFLPLWVLAQSADYFQQEVDYDIRVRLDEAAHTLHGDLTLTYTNHAPTALDSIYFHLWPRAYSSDETAFARQQLRNGATRFHFAADSLRGTLDSLDFVVNGAAADFHFTEDPDIGVLRLPTPLAPGTAVTITTPFRVRVPASFSRLGHVGTSYQLTQWYPKPAVYDREGWHPMPYLDQGEFYSEFGSFRVAITLPKNYVVAATGVLQEPGERQWLLDRADSTRRALARRTDLPTAYVEEAYPPAASAYKTVTYTAERVHDFAWFADKRFQVLHDTLILRPRPNGALADEGPVDVWAFFTETDAAYWKNATDYLKRATQFYSEHVGSYPYPQVTGVQSALSAGGGMEYPMITVIGQTGSDYDLDEVLTHEVGHNWFYGILGSNERDHAWMDEGLNSYYEGRYTARYYPEREGRAGFIPGLAVDLDLLGYRYQSRMGQDQAPDTRSDSLALVNYWLGAYGKPDLVLQELAARIGTDRLDARMQDYYRQWQFRHPRPEDFYAAMEEADYLRDAMETTTEGSFNRQALRQPKRGLRLGFITNQESEARQFFVTPLIGFNANDGFLAGGALHNRTLEPRKVEFVVAPLYGFGSKALAGFAGARYRLARPIEGLRRVELSGGVQRFGDFRPTAEVFDGLDLTYPYTRTALRSSFFFDHPPISSRESQLYSQWIRLQQQRPGFDDDGNLLGDPLAVVTNFLAAGYRSERDLRVRYLGYDVRLEYRKGDPELFRPVDNLRLQTTLRGGYMYQRFKLIQWRVFGGVFLYHSEREGASSPAYSFSLVDNAASDYRYDDLYFGRNRDGGYEQQLETRQGGVRAPLSAAFTYGRSNTYLMALNLDADLPIPLPLGVYVDAGLYGFRPTLNSTPSNELNFVAGLTVNLLGDQFQLALPLLADDTTKRLLQERGNLAERLVLRLNLTKLLPWRLIDSLP